LRPSSPLPLPPPPPPPPPPAAAKAKVKEMIEARKVANIIESEKEKAYAYEGTVRPYLDDIRIHIDKLELIVDNELWPLPKYRELLFVR
jgi:glutamine synthetase